MKTKLLAFSLVGMALFSMNSTAKVTRVAYGGITCADKVTEEEITTALETLKAKNFNLKYLSLTLEKMDDASLSIICKKCSTARTVRLTQSPDLTTLAPLAGLKDLRYVTIRGVGGKIDCSPLSALTKVTNLSLEKVSVLNPDLTFLTPLSELTTLSLEYLPDGISLKGIEGPKGLKRLSLIHMTLADPTPLADCDTVTELSLRYSTVDNLGPVGGMDKLEEINLYGAKLKDFTPLAKAPNLEKITYYAVRMPAPENFQTLGTLKQVKKFHGGLNKMNSLEWIRQTPQIEELKTFAEKITDFTPVSTARKLKLFRAWNMNVGDLAFLTPLTRLEKLELPGSTFSNLEALSSLTQIEELELSYLKKEVDLGIFKNFKKLQKLYIQNSEVSHLDILPSFPELQRLNISKVKGSITLDILKKCPKLKNITASKSQFTKEQANELMNEAKSNKRRVYMNVY